MKQASEYLAFLRSPPEPSPTVQRVGTVTELLSHVRLSMPIEPIALLLSGGVDSCSLATFLPRGSACYTVVFPELGQSEAPDAGRYVPEGCRHEIVTVTWADYEREHDRLAASKGYALTGIEPAVLVAMKRAKADGYSTVMTGMGADINFGDLGRLNAFTNRERLWRAYLKWHVDPVLALREPHDASAALNQFTRLDGSVDAREFSLTLAWGDVLAVDNAARVAGVRHVAPFATRAATNDTAKPGKPLIRAMHARNTGRPWRLPKRGFRRPMSKWLANYEPTREEFITPLPALRADQRFYVYSLERWLGMEVSA